MSKTKSRKSNKRRATGLEGLLEENKHQEAIARNELLEEDLILSSRYEFNHEDKSSIQAFDSTRDWFKIKKQQTFKPENDPQTHSRHNSSKGSVRANQN